MAARALLVFTLALFVAGAVWAKPGGVPVAGKSNWEVAFKHGAFS